MFEFRSPSATGAAIFIRPTSVRLALACLLLLLMVSASALPLSGHWRAASPAESPEAARNAAPGASDAVFDPSELTAIPAGENGTWIRLWPLRKAPGSVPMWPAGDWVIEVRDPGLQAISFFPARGPAVANAGVMQPRAGWQGHGRIGLVLDQTALGNAPLLLRMEPGRVVATPLRFAFVSPEEFRREDGRWLALASACLAFMVAMSLMALLFAVGLRDVTFVYYAGYVLAYALLLAIQTGFVASPLEWTWLAHAPGAWERAATGVSALFATLFVAAFADLAHFAPRMRMAVLALGATLFVLMALGSLPFQGLIGVASVLVNPLLILAGSTMLVANVLAWWRGSRYAGFFLLGWTPLLAVTVLVNAQMFGILLNWTWLPDASLVTGAFEAVVLSLGLGDRALALRHDRDIAQSQADSDALTNVFNRRGLDRRMAVLVEQALRQRRPLSVLFLDLDRFKLLNDHQGHAVGDAALIAVARLMRSDVRAYDVLGRYGGEELVAALPGCDIGVASRIAERMRAHLHALAIPVTSPGDFLTVSIGVAALERGDDAQALIARADRAMYAAKRAGGNRIAAAAMGGGSMSVQTA